MSTVGLKTIAKKIISLSGMYEIAKRNKEKLKPLVKYCGMKTNKGELEFDCRKQTIVIVSHEASETGAPILCLNLCLLLKQRYNIITILVRGGTLRKTLWQIPM